MHALWLVSKHDFNNNTLFSVIFLISFFLNKDFHSCMSFELNVIEYENSYERLQMTKVENIFKHMNKILKFMLWVCIERIIWVYSN